MDLDRLHCMDSYCATDLYIAFLYKVYLEIH